MSGELFNRKYKFTVGLIGGIGTTVEELNIKFKINKYGSKKPDVANFEVYNMSKLRRNEFSSKGLDFIFEAGYANEFGLIFKGKLELSNHVKTDTEWITTVELKDGADKLRSVIINESFAAGTSEFDILKKLIKLSGVEEGFVKTAKEAAQLFSNAETSFNLPKSLLIKDLKASTYNKGVALSGSFDKVFSDFCTSNGLEWTFTDGKLNVLPVGATRPIATINVNPNAGLIGSPEKLERGIKFISLLRPIFIPGAVVKLESKEIKGEYIIRNVEHVGEYDSQSNWNSIVECIEK